MAKIEEGADILRARERLDLSLERLSEMTGAPGTTISSWEHGTAVASKLELRGVKGFLEDYEESYRRKLQEEVGFFDQCDVHNLPDIFHYWSNKHLLPLFGQFGFHNTPQLFGQYMTQMCRRFPEETCRFISVGSGTCDLEIAIVQEVVARGVTNFCFECLELNATMLERGRQLAEQESVVKQMSFCENDINSWKPKGVYHLVIAIHSLHHFVELEALFDKIRAHLHPRGYFLADDMIGRNGHQRWPEALQIVQELWKELPEPYRYNHLLQRNEEEYENWDCSSEGFEGIRAQDILPLLLERFGFALFIPYSNIIDIFIERCFGHNFDPNREWDWQFIDRVHALDEKYLKEGRIKPTHMVAAMTRSSVPTKIRGSLTPEFCIRKA